MQRLKVAFRTRLLLLCLLIVLSVTVLFIYNNYYSNSNDKTLSSIGTSSVAAVGIRATRGRDFHDSSKIVYSNGILVDSNTVIASWHALRDTEVAQVSGGNGWQTVSRVVAGSELNDWVLLRLRGSIDSGFSAQDMLQEPPALNQLVFFDRYVIDTSKAASCSFTAADMPGMSGCLVASCSSVPGASGGPVWLASGGPLLGMVRGTFSGGTIIIPISTIRLDRVWSRSVSVGELNGISSGINRSRRLYSEAIALPSGNAKIMALRRAIDEWDENFFAWIALIREYHELHDTSLFNTWLQDAKARFRSSSWAMGELAELATRLQADTFALDVINEQLTKDRRWIRGWELRSILYNRVGNYVQSINNVRLGWNSSVCTELLFEQGLLASRRLGDADMELYMALQYAEEFSESESAWYRLGIACRNKNDLSKSIDAFVRGMSCDKSHDDLIENLAYVCLLDGRNAQAVGWYEMLVDERPNYADARFGLATALYNIGNIDEAIAQCVASIALGYRRDIGAEMLGDILVKRRNWAEATAWYEDAVAHGRVEVELYWKSRVCRWVLFWSRLFPK